MLVVSVGLIFNKYRFLDSSGKANINSFDLLSVKVEGKWFLKKFWSVLNSRDACSN
jgi:hypothetical protein